MVQNKNKLKVSANVYNIVGELFNCSISYFFSHYNKYYVEMKVNNF
jgi:hypothetical protein